MDVKKSLASLVSAIALTASVAGTAHAAAPPPTWGYVDASARIQVRLSADGRFAVITPSGSCEGFGSPFTDQRRRAQVSGGTPGCLTEFWADKRRASGYVVVAGHRSGTGTTYIRYDFDAVDSATAHQPVRRSGRALRIR